MSSVPEFQTLLVLTQAKYDQQKMSFQKLVSEENRLRAELSRLDEAARQTQEGQAGEREMRAIGADIIWQGWVTRTKTQLNIKLAQVLSLKASHLAQVKKAYGKVLVVKQLIDQAQADLRTKNAHADLAQAIEHTLFK